MLRTTNLTCISNTKIVLKKHTITMFTHFFFKRWKVAYPLSSRPVHGLIKLPFHFTYAVWTKLTHPVKYHTVFYWLKWRTYTKLSVTWFYIKPIITLILPRSHTGTVWFYTSTSNKRAARPKLYTESLTGDLKLMYSRFTLVRISINL